MSYDYETCFLINYLELIGFRIHIDTRININAVT